MNRTTDGGKHNGVIGQTISELVWAKVDTAMEPNGFYYGVYNWLVKETWFHPYNGAAPEKIG